MHIPDMATKLLQEVHAEIRKVQDGISRANDMLTLEQLQRGDRSYVLGQLQRAADAARSVVHMFIHGTDEIRMEMQVQWEKEDDETDDPTPKAEAKSAEVVGSSARFTPQPEA